MNADPSIPPKPGYVLRNDLPASGAIFELRDWSQWVAWTYRFNAQRGAWAKIPITPSTGRNASVSNPDTWSDYKSARVGQLTQQLAGVGIVLTTADDLIGGDLDGVIDESGAIAPWAREMVEAAETYWETTPSGRGLRFLARGRLDATLKCDAAGVEVYDRGRYLTITGQHLSSTPDAIRPAPRTLAALAARVAAHRKPAEAQADPKAEPKNGWHFDTGVPPGGSGGTFFRAVNEAALAALDRWVPAIFPTAVHQPGTNAWRVTSRALGRGLEEDLSLAPTGIQDFGEERGLTAIDVVMQWGNAPDALAAGLWLCERLGRDPESLGFRPAEGQSAGAGAAQDGPRGGEERADAPDDGPTIRPRVFTLRDPAEIPPRQWLYGRHLVRGFVSATVAPGGLGKSSMVQAEALAMATGRNLLGDAPCSPLKVWLWNGEDPAEELERRITAACIHYGITGADLSDRLLMDSGRDVPITLATMANGSVRIARPVADALIAAIRGNAIDALIVDPFVTSHLVPENENTMMNAVVAEWRRIVDATGCAVELVHHVSKAGATNGNELGIYAARGAVAVTDGVRAARYLTRMQQDEADRLGIEATGGYFRVHAGKANLALAEKSTWRRMIGVCLGNGSGLWPDGDDVGVCTAWTPPDAFAGMTVSDLKRVQDAIAASADPPKANERAADWAGLVIGDVLGLDLGRDLKKSERTPAQNISRAKVRQLLSAWLKSGALATETLHDPRTGRNVKVIIVGEPVSSGDLGAA